VNKLIIKVFTLRDLKKYFTRFVKYLVTGTYPFCGNKLITDFLKGYKKFFSFAFREFIVISPAGKEILGNETRAGQVDT
jgi:hypothetical protein